MSEIRTEQVPQQATDPLNLEIGTRVKIVTTRGGFVFVCALSLAIIVLAIHATPLGVKAFEKIGGWLMSLIG